MQPLLLLRAGLGQRGHQIHIATRSSGTVAVVAAALLADDEPEYRRDGEAGGNAGGAASAGHLASAADELGKETGSGVQHNVPLAGAKRVVHYLPWAPGRSS
eukprot:XP_001702047.1 predicted protein [Chlamydomonas reinhardtii]